ncbi:MAG: T9SS type A sorting domain-containing protein [Bacteroidales bacterium]|nr:T9SS type A sorting domain-containing protein [Bacteroidales bacterium]MBN2820117.1 T9SS type A sorting domain-containing protein [Bacteroidales bacterium]
MRLSFYIILLLLAISSFFSGIIAQPWIYEYSSRFKNTENTELSFEQQQEAFNRYWENRTDRKSKGYKPHLRWAFFTEQRLMANSQPDLKGIWNDFTEESLLESGDSLKWIFSGPNQTPFAIGTTDLTGNGRLNCVRFHPTNPDIIYVGAPTGGLWITKDGGGTWNTTTDFLDIIGVSDIAVSPTDPNNIYIVTGDGDGNKFQTYAMGILKSNDGGKTWEPTSLSLNVTQRISFSRIIINPNNPAVMIATSTAGIYKTTNAWESYTMVQAGNFKDIEYKPGNTSYVYATSYDGYGNAKIYRSTNGGNSFSVVSDALNLTGKVERIELAVTQNNANIIYALFSDVENSGLYGLFKSTDSGSTWSFIYDGTKNKNLLGRNTNGSDQGGQGWYDLALAVSPTNSSILFVGGINIWRSTDSGISWTIMTDSYHDSEYPYVHVDQHMLAYSPHTNDLFVANDGGIYKSTDNGNTWEDISNNLKILQSYRIGISKTTNNKILSGNQDNGTFFKINQNWFEVFGGDGMECFFDHQNDNTFYVTTQSGNLYKTTSGGSDFTSIKPDALLSGYWITPFVIHPSNQNILYAGYQDVYKTTDKGSTWTKISDNLSGENLIALAVSANNDDYIYTANFDTIFKTRDGGLSWQIINSNLPFLNISSITISPNDPNKVWVCFYSYTDEEKIYYSTNGGNSWSNYSVGLPNVPVNKLAVRENSYQELFAATDIGVYYRNANMNHWQKVNFDLPNVLVYDLELSAEFDKIYAATFGRGIWEAELPPVVLPKADFTADITRGCVNAPIRLSYTGVSDFDSLKWIYNTAEFISASKNNDTIVIKYPDAGLKSITLQHFRNDTLTTELKYQFIEILTDLKINISPTNYYICNAISSLEINVPSGYTYAFFPEEIIDSIVDNTITISPKINDTIFKVTAIHGVCESYNELNIRLIPDNLSDAQILLAGLNGIFSNGCAGREEMEPTPPIGTGASNGCISQDGWCGSEDTVRHSVWFKVIVPQNGKLRIKVNGFDSKIALYSASSYENLFSGNYELIAANDDISSSVYDSEIELLSGLKPGDTLYLQVDGSYGGITGEFWVNISDSLTSVKRVRATDYQNYLVYPNPTPASGHVQVKFLNTLLSPVSIELISSNGIIIERKEIDKNTTIIEETFSTSPLKGIYFIRISTNENFFIQKLIVE